MDKKCGFKAQGHVCALDADHVYDDWFRDVDGSTLVEHQDKDGFRFINERWPTQLGNGPDGYPMNNAAFDRAAKKVLDERKEDYEKAKAFLKRLAYVPPKR